MGSISIIGSGSMASAIDRWCPADCGSSTWGSLRLAAEEFDLLIRPALLEAVSLGLGDAE